MRDPWQTWKTRTFGKIRCFTEEQVQDQVQDELLEVSLVVRLEVFRMVYGQLQTEVGD